MIFALEDNPVKARLPLVMTTVALVEISQADRVFCGFRPDVFIHQVKDQHTIPVFRYQPLVFFIILFQFINQDICDHFIGIDAV
ncbi:hypothetical protein D9M68_857270 [compost metagenome]